MTNPTPPTYVLRPHTKEEYEDSLDDEPETQAPAPDPDALRVLLVAASADWSIADVSTGYEAALHELGCNVSVFRLNRRITAWASFLNFSADENGVDRPPLAAIIREASDQLLIHAARFRPDLILVISAMALHPDVLFFLKDYGYKTAVVFTEAPYDDENHLYLAPLFSYVFSNDAPSAEVLRTVNPESFYLPTAYSKTVHRPDLVPPETCDVLFVGTGFPERTALLEAAVTDPAWPKDATFHLIGFWSDDPNNPTPPETSPLFPFWRPPITNDETAARYCGAKIVINLYRTGSQYSMNPRAYEAAACGVFQISQDLSEEAHEIFGNSIAYFSTPHELAETVAYCLDPRHSRGCRAMAEESRRAVQGHDYTNRLLELLSITGCLTPRSVLDLSSPLMFGNPAPNLLRSSQTE